jgi:hypothetical protein
MKALYGTLFLLGTVALTGCQFKFDTPILPNISLRDIPSGTDKTKVDPAQNNTEQSRSTQKSVLATLKFGTSVTSELGVSSTANCVQLVELSSGGIVVDFGKNACPVEKSVPMNPSNLVFTATYEFVSGDIYRLIFKGDDIGEMELGADRETMTLKYHCTSRYNTRCYQPISAGKYSAIPVIY